MIIELVIAAGAVLGIIWASVRMRKSKVYAIGIIRDVDEVKEGAD